jgi:hypothetical protein
MALKCFYRVLRARWIVATTCGKERRNGELVTADQINESSAHYLDASMKVPIHVAISSISAASCGKAIP